MARSIDALFLSHYEDLDRWYNDHLVENPSRSGSSGQRAVDCAAEDPITRERRLRSSVRLDGHLYDQPRFLSWARYGTTVEYPRYDAFAFTHLSGSYFRSFLGRHGFEVEHLQAADRLSLAALAESIRPRYVLISTSLMSETARIMEVCQQVRAQWPDAGVILGGLGLVELFRSLHPLAMRHLLKAWRADAYVISPLGEEPLLEILLHSPDELPGLELPRTWVRGGDDYRLSTERAEEGLPIDETYVRWSRLEPSSLYHTVNVRTARSCAFTCAFCTFKALQDEHEVNRPETFERELAELRDNGAVRSIFFTDDTLNVPPKRFKELCRVLRRFDFEWYSFFRPQHTDEEMAELMAESGCRGVFMGLESVDDAMLKRMHKSATHRTATRGISLLKRHDIACHVNFIIGYPGDVPANNRAIVPFMEEADVDFYCLGPYYHSPTAPIHQEREKYGLEGQFWRWKHDTMDIEQALELEEELIRTPTRAEFVSELAQSTFWGEVMLLCNGFDVDQTKRIMGIYNHFAGVETSGEAVRGTPEFRELMGILESRELPRPPGSSIVGTGRGEGAR